MRAPHKETPHECSIKKVERHLRNVGLQRNFVLTPKLMKHWWSHLNRAIFKGTLHDTVELRATTGLLYRTQCWAQCWQGANGVIIQMDKHCVPKLTHRIGFLTILAHEMVHQYQIENDFPVGHGRSFKRWDSNIRIVLDQPLTEIVDASLILKQYNPQWFNN